MLEELENLTDESLDGIRLSTADGRRRALEALVGEAIPAACLRGDPDTCSTLDDFGPCRMCVANQQLGRLRSPWTLGVLRRALLLVDQLPIEEGFYAAFFGDAALSNTQLLAGIAQFRARAMLAFGNFRFAYKELAGARTEDDVRAKLGRWGVGPSVKIAAFAARPDARKLVRPINRDDRWLLGYISPQQLLEDFALEAALRKARDGVELSTDERGRVSNVPEPDRAYWLRNLDKAKGDLDKYQARLKAARARGIANTVAYLAANHIDVYVATSKRQRWEYEATKDFIDRVVPLVAAEMRGLVHFDPTLAFSRDRIDKGLIEGLMLRRALVTIYMTQDVDTLGKDSELAATLAQGNVVIAYVESKSVDELAARFRREPLAYLRSRALQHLAEGRLKGADLKLVHAALDPETGSLAQRVVFYLLDRRGRRNSDAERAKLEPIIAAVARAEALFLQKRAATLRDTHPLALQLEQATGVAQGVLVARSAEQCAQLVIRALTNSLAFDIRAGARPVKEEPPTTTLLVEKISGCPFRVVTTDTTLTNAFWALYKSRDARPTSSVGRSTEKTKEAPTDAETAAETA